MRTQPVQLSQCEARTATRIDEILHALLAEPFGDRPGAFPARATAPRRCDGCGLVSPGVDLWAEDPETGEVICLCPACGDC